MTKLLSKDDLIKHQQGTIRREWLRCLREEGNRQCVGLYRDIEVGVAGRYATVAAIAPSRVCAIALLGEITDGPQWWRHRTNQLITTRAIGAKAGLNPTQVEWIVNLNDGGRCSLTGKMVRPHTFRQIASVVEKWFPNG